MGLRAGRPRSAPDRGRLRRPSRSARAQAAGARGSDRVFDDGFRRDSLGVYRSRSEDVPWRVAGRVAGGPGRFDLRAARRDRRRRPGLGSASDGRDRPFQRREGGHRRSADPRLPFIYLSRRFGNEPPRCRGAACWSPCASISSRILGILLGAAYVYIARSGNQSDITPSAFELSLRSNLTALLGVRPRFKEFLIGWPLVDAAPGACRSSSGAGPAGSSRSPTRSRPPTW